MMLRDDEDGRLFVGVAGARVRLNGGIGGSQEGI